MSENSWPESDSFNELDLGAALVAALPEDEFELEIDPAFLRGLKGRQLKAAVVLAGLWSGTVALHTVPVGYGLMTGVAALMAVHCLRAFVAKPRATVAPIAIDDAIRLPLVSLMVAAKNEEAVIERLVTQLCNLDYPSDRYEVWVVDDNSSDRTPELLDRLAQHYPQLQVVHRPAGAGGGKSGALNQVFARAKGDFFGVFDADAQVEPDVLQRSLGAFTQPRVGALQLRKAIVQAQADHPDHNNFWIQGQQAEMALDAFMRQQQIVVGGLGELRGNGQFVRRQALEQCGGWNEETITDDLDLTLRLHMNQWDIECLTLPVIHEEGVTTAVALWHQRSRWAEGGYQRYLDYWRLIGQNRMGTAKTIDWLVFVIMQYVMPMAAIPDLLMALLYRHAPLLTPITSLTFGLFIVSAMRGLRRPLLLDPARSSLGLRQGWLVPARQSLIGALYMAHWLPVMAFTTARMALRPKQLKWVKTVHTGTDSAEH
jgi:1,2-diacylglycerol 3-beta-glucosyltransferase